MFSYHMTSFKVMCEKSSIIGQNSILFEQMVIMLLYKIPGFKVMVENSQLL